MPRYQFFTFPNNQITDFTYLEVDSEYYQADKLALIDQNFELDGGPITAATSVDAVKKYNRDFSRISQEQVKMSFSYVLIEGVIALWKWIRNK